ncbi:hypothetical protein HG530_010019 [Fusarium avenaceum]|nr:hypothetical protein HG530_010019 [Fusarium avenaceum]
MFSRPQRKKKSVSIIIILPALLVVLVIEASRGHSSGRCIGCSPLTRRRQEFFNKNLDDLKRSGNNGILVGELNNVLSTRERETGKDKNKGLDKGRSLGGSKSVSDSLEKLGEERTKTLLASLLNELSSQATNLRGRVVLNRRTQKSIDDVETDFQTGTATGILPGENLLVVVLEHPLDNLGSWS